MSTTTQEDYFGTSVDSNDAERRHKSSRRKHHSSKPRSYEEDDEYISPRELVQEAKRSARKSSSRHRKESSNPHYYDGSNISEEEDPSSVSTSDEEERRRKRKHKKRRDRERRERERDREMERSERSSIPDDVSSTVPEASSATDTEGDTASTSTIGRKKRRDRAKSVGENAIAALGLQETYQRVRSRSRGRKESLTSDEGYDSTEEEGRARSHSRMQSNAAQAAIIAAAVEAFRARKEPGGPAGSKSLKRVVEAAVASGFAEKFLERKGEDDSKSNKRVAEAVLAGLAAQRGINGRRRRRREDGDDEANPVRDLVASGLIGAAGKKILDYQRSRSQSVGGERGRSDDPERPGLERKRSRSVGEALAALGLGGLAANKLVKSRKDKKRRSGIEDSDSDSDSSASSISDGDLSLDEESEQKRHKLLRRKEIISIALAILATLHLGHTGYEAHEKRANRKEKLESGRITEEESSKIRRKNYMGDAATVGLAVLAATEAVKSFKSMQKRRHEYHEFDNQVEEHRRRRDSRKTIEGRHRSHSPGGEANKYYSQPGYMGAPPGAQPVPTYPYYPASGRIPETYNRGGREIPVVYPSSVTHA